MGPCRTASVLIAEVGLLSPSQLWINGCSQSTTIGATFLAYGRRADARLGARVDVGARRCPMTLLKMPGSVFLALTLIVSFGRRSR